MRKVKVITDSCSDLSPELLERYGIDYAKMSSVRNGKETEAKLDWSKDESHAFFDAMRNGERITTSQATSSEFERLFTQYLDDGYDIVYVGCSSKQSGSVNTSNVTAKRILNQYSDAEIYCIDSLNASIGEGMLAIEAAKMALEGNSAKQIFDRIISIRKNVREFVTVHTLEYLKRAGRVTASSAFFGNLMGIKPILISDVNGVQTAVKKVKGRQNSITEMVEQTKSVIREPENQTVYVIEADSPKEDVEFLCNQIHEKIKCKDVCVLGLGPIIGASIGPDALGVFSFGEPETFVAAE